jgi:hypothetical protein
MARLNETKAVSAYTKRKKRKKKKKKKKSITLLSDVMNSSPFAQTCTQVHDFRGEKRESMK